MRKSRRDVDKFVPANDKPCMKISLIIASLLGGIAVVLGAFGAHALKRVLNADQLLSWETGVRYQMFHALALLAVGLLIDRGFPLRPTLALFTAGTFLFSGSIYLLSLEIGPRAFLGPVTPLGGTLLIAGWAWLLKVSLTSPLS